MLLLFNTSKYHLTLFILGPDDGTPYPLHMYSRMIVMSQETLIRNITSFEFEI